MIEKYEIWIAENITENPYGKCHELSKKMLESFPELKLVRGHYVCPIWGKRGHWWLVTEDGENVDPSKRQFPSGGTGKYILWNEGDEEPTGLCMNCSEYTYHGDNFCCNSCETEYFCDNFSGYMKKGLHD